MNREIQGIKDKYNNRILFIMKISEILQEIKMKQKSLNNKLQRQEISSS